MRKLVISSLAAVVILVAYGLYLGIADVNAAGENYGQVCSPHDPTCIPDCEHQDKCFSGPTCEEKWDGETAESCEQCREFVGKGIAPYLRGGECLCLCKTKLRGVVCGYRYKCQYYSWAGCTKGSYLTTVYISQCFGYGYNPNPVTCDE